MFWLQWTPSSSYVATMSPMPIHPSIASDNVQRGGHLCYIRRHHTPLCFVALQAVRGVVLRCTVSWLMSAIQRYLFAWQCYTQRVMVTPSATMRYWLTQSSSQRNGSPIRMEIKCKRVSLKMRGNHGEVTWSLRSIYELPHTLSWRVVTACMKSYRHFSTRQVRNQVSGVVPLLWCDHLIQYQQYLATSAIILPCCHLLNLMQPIVFCHLDKCKMISKRRFFRGARSRFKTRFMDDRSIQYVVTV